MEVVRAAVLLALLAGSASGARLSRSRLLLPPSARASRVQARLEVQTADEPYQWSASPGLQIDPTADGTAAEIAATSWSGYRWEGSVSATGSRSGTSLSSSVEVDAPGRIELVHAAHQVPSGSSVDLSVLAYTEYGDQFSTIQGLRFSWFVTSSDPSPADASIDPLSQSESALLTGLSPGSVNASVVLVEERFDRLSASRAFLVTSNYTIDPEPPNADGELLLAPGGNLNLQAKSHESRSSSAQHTSFRWLMKDPSIASVGEVSGELVAHCTGHTRVELFLSDSSGAPVGHRDIRVQKPSRLQLLLEPSGTDQPVEQWSSGQWPLKANGTYVVHVSVADSSNKKRFTLTDNERLSVDALASAQAQHEDAARPLLQQLGERAAPMSSERHMLSLGHKPVSGAHISAELSQHLQLKHSQNCTDDARWHRLSTQQYFQVCSPIVALPEISAKEGAEKRLLHLPLPGRASGAVREEYPLEFAGGCLSGNPARWYVEDNMIARLDERSEHVVARKRGKTTVVVQPQRDIVTRHLGDEIGLLASAPSHDGRPGVVRGELGVDVQPEETAFLEAMYLGEPDATTGLLPFTICGRLQSAIAWKAHSGAVRELRESTARSYGACAAAIAQLSKGSTGRVSASIHPEGPDAQPLVLSWNLTTVQPLRAIIADTSEIPLKEVDEETVAAAVGGKLSVYLEGGPAEGFPFPNTVFSHSTSGPVQLRQSPPSHNVSTRSFDLECTASGAALVTFYVRREAQSGVLASKELHLDCAHATSLELTAAASFANGKLGFTQSNKALIPRGASTLVKAYALDGSGRRLVAPPADAPLEMRKLEHSGFELQLNGVGAWAARQASSFSGSAGGMIRASATGLSTATVELIPVDGTSIGLTCPLYLLDDAAATMESHLSGGSGHFAISNGSTSAAYVDAHISGKDEDILSLTPRSVGSDTIAIVDKVTGEAVECSITIASAAGVDVYLHNDTVLVGSSSQADVSAFSASGNVLHAGPNARALRASLKADDNLSHESIDADTAANPLRATSAASFILRPSYPGIHSFNALIRAERHRPSRSLESACLRLRAYEQLTIVNPPQESLWTTPGAMHAVEVKSRPHEALQFATLHSSNNDVISVQLIGSAVPSIPVNGSETATFFVKAARRGDAVLSVGSSEVDPPVHSSINIFARPMSGVAIRAPSTLEVGKKAVISLQPRPLTLSSTALGACTHIQWNVSDTSKLRIVSRDEQKHFVNAMIEGMHEGKSQIIAQVHCTGSSFDERVNVDVMFDKSSSPGHVKPLLLPPAVIDGSPLFGPDNDTVYTLMEASQMSPALELYAEGRELRPARHVSAAESCAIAASGVPRHVGPCVRIAHPAHLPLTGLQPSLRGHWGNPTISIHPGARADLRVDAIDSNGIDFSRPLPGQLIWIESNNTVRSSTLALFLSVLLADLTLQMPIVL